jgi:radical SAM-linked protein
MMRLWHRALRRSGLPLRMTEGFHVRPRVSFAMARGVGVASQAEWLEFELTDWVNPDTAHKQLAPQVPDGVVIRSLEVVPPAHRAVVREIVYALRPAALPPDTDERIARMLARREIVVERGDERRRRRIDIRPMLTALERRGPLLRLVAECQSRGSLRPEEVLDQLGLAADEIRATLITRLESKLQGP